MITITQKLKEKGILVSDGAWGTLLQARGLEPGTSPELWNLERPDEVFQVALSYVEAGSDMIETNSFGGNTFKLFPYGLSSRVYDLNIAAAEISKKAAGSKLHVLGSIGPTGKMLLMGDVSEEELYAAFRDQAVALADGGADALVIETMSDIEEAKIAVKACKENTSAEIICTMTFGKTSEATFHTMMGVTPTQMADEMLTIGADIIGANCGNGMQNMIGIVSEIRKHHKDIPVLIHANAGMPEYRDGKTVFPESPEEMSRYVRKLIDAGANIIGGCCGTTPEHIRAMKRIIENS